MLVWILNYYRIIALLFSMTFCGIFCLDLGESGLSHTLCKCSSPQCQLLDCAVQCMLLLFASYTLSLWPGLFLRLSPLSELWVPSSSVCVCACALVKSLICSLFERGIKLLSLSQQYLQQRNHYHPISLWVCDHRLAHAHTQTHTCTDTRNPYQYCCFQ